VRVLAHINKLADAFGQFRVRIACGCGASREWCAEAPEQRSRLRVRDPSQTRL